MSQYCLGQLNLVVKYSKLGLVLALVSWTKKQNSRSHNENNTREKTRGPK
jgi:hypothetical protein